MTNPSANRPTVLVVDDQALNLTICEAILADRYDVVSVGSGAQALEKVAERAPDLIMLDVMMPGMDGFTLAHKVRLLPHLRQVPIIFLTARDGPLDTIKGIQAGARHYVTKPFKIEDLVGKVKKVLG